MRLHLVRSSDLFGPQDRMDELASAGRINATTFAAPHTITDYTGRPHFSELFDLFLPDRLNILANADIYFDISSRLDALKGMKPGTVAALSRWEVGEGAPFLHDRPDSQDAWIHYGRLPVIPDAPYPLGVPGCDNAIAHALAACGLRVVNPSRTVRAYHLHRSKHRSYLSGGRKVYRIPPPYLTIPPSALLAEDFDR